MKSLLMLIFGMMLVCNGNARAGLVAWGNIDFVVNYSNVSTGEFGYQINIYNNEARIEPYFSALLFNYDCPDQSISYVTTTIAIGSEWWFVDFGDEINRSTLDSGVYDRFIDAWIPMNVSDEFYLAGNTRETFGGQDVFGWVGFRQTPSGLVMFDNAAAYDALSLTAGTFNFVPVPEPTPIALFLLGVLTLIGFKKRTISKLL